MTGIKTYVDWFDGRLDGDSQLLSMQPSYVDLLTSSRRFIGTSAIKFNRVVLLNTSPRLWNTKDIAEAARIRGFSVEHVPNKQMTDLRAALSPATNIIMARNMVAPFIKKLGDLAPLFIEQASDDTITYARVINAFRYRGEMTHALIWQNGDESTIREFYASAEDAMLDYMKRNDVRESRIVCF